MTEKRQVYQALCRLNNNVSRQEVDAAVLQGYSLADKTVTSFPGLSVRETAETAGIGIRYVTGGMCAGKLICGAFCPRGRFIELYRDGLSRLESIRDRLPAVDVNLEDIVIAHELYHALSAHRSDRSSLTTAAEDGSTLPEVSAAAFATRLCGLPFEAPLIDCLLRREVVD
ncbi:MAG: hypothetical protein PHT33_05715 [bacterium]|nr:hypothetical protein [bacterium]